MTDAESSSRFFSALGTLSKSLCKSELAIYGVAFDLLHFGSWTVELGKRHHRSLLQWDGKEFLMSLSNCDVADSQAPREWKLVAEERIVQYSGDRDLFRAAENLISEKAGY